MCICKSRRADQAPTLNSDHVSAPERALENPLKWFAVEVYCTVLLRPTMAPVEGQQGGGIAPRTCAWRPMVRRGFTCDWQSGSYANQFSCFQNGPTNDAAIVRPVTHD